jgi:hypothetical protein
MNFYEFNKKLMEQKIKEGILGSIGQNFQQGFNTLNKSMGQGWQQIDQMQNARQNQINSNETKNLQNHLAQLIKKMGLDPNNLQNEIKTLFEKIEEMKKTAEAETTAAGSPTPTPSVSDWSSL